MHLLPGRYKLRVTSADGGELYETEIEDPGKHKQRAYVAPEVAVRVANNAIGTDNALERLRGIPFARIAPIPHAQAPDARHC